MKKLLCAVLVLVFFTLFSFNVATSNTLIKTDKYRVCDATPGPWYPGAPITTGQAITVDTTQSI